MRKVFLALLAAALPAISAMAEAPADEQMAHRIGSQLKQSGQLHNYEIGVKYHDGVACLEGKVTNPEQRRVAVRLAQKVKGVSRVECKLAIANESKSNGDEQFRLASTESASLDDSQAESSGAMHAYQQQREPASMPSQQQQLMMANSARVNGTGMNNMRSQRNNMPLPSRQMPSMMPVRQASAMGASQAGCQGCNGGASMGPGTCGPGMGGGAPMGHVPQGGGSGPSYENPRCPAMPGRAMRRTRTTPL